MRFSVALLGKTVLTVGVGFVVGLIGTIMHRSVQPWGLVLALLLVLTAATTARALGGLVAWIGFVAGLGVTVLALSQEGPGGDVLIPSGPKLGVVWLVGSMVLAVAAMFLPRAWFSDAPRPARPARPVAGDAVGEPDTTQ
ncbi:hypothetical protein [Cellulomonas sp. URHD0024]|uniref:hypothetical protein n=1 Tax=Cellulomonas sp. URHD0024 TaxID=1302620 RepID=UPI0004210E9E|nr:hypothetical protein [Cellulomonas sp. URHD0024]